MASQGPNNPTTFANDSSVGSISWSDEGNAGASDNLRAETGTTTTTPTHYLRATNFGFSIPSGATIDGVVVGLERRDPDDWRPIDNSVRLYNGSAFVGDNKATATTWPVTDTYEDHGGPTDDWNASLTDTIVNSTGFGVGISAQRVFGSMRPEIDHIRITVYYTAAAGGARSSIIVAGL